MVEPVSGRGTVVVAAVSAAVAALVSVATTLLVLRFTDIAEPDRPLAATSPSGTSSPTIDPATGAGLGGAGLDLAGLFARVASGVVRIETTACVLGGAGSGFLVAPDLVVTAAHVVDGAHAIGLRRGDGTGVGAQVVGIDTVHDVALLRAADPFVGHVFGFAAALPAVGTDVAALGYPLSGPLVPVRRTVIGLGESLDISGTASSAVTGPDVVRDLVRFDGGFEPGDSGGPVVAADGLVIGLVEGRSLADRSSGYAVAGVRVAPLVARWRTERTPIDVSDSCAAPVGPPQARVVVRDESGSGLGPLVAGFFGGYASAINSARYEEAWELLTPTFRAGRTLQEWEQDERSSQLFDAVVRRVQVTSPGAAPTTSTPTGGAVATSPTSGPTSGPTGEATAPVPVVTPGAGGRLSALVEFSSTQEDRLGPGGQTCSRWRLTYTLVRSQNRWQIDAASLAPGYPQSC